MSIYRHGTATLGFHNDSLGIAWRADLGILNKNRKWNEKEV